MTMRNGLIGYVVTYDDRIRHAHDLFLDLLENELPVVEEAGIGEVYVDLKGMERRYGHPVTIVSRLVGMFQQRLYPDIQFQAGIGNGKFVAKMAAVQSKGGNPVFIPPGESQRFLAPLSIDYLPINDALKDRFSFLGLHQLEDVAKLPLEAVVAQFGAEGRLASKFASGIDDRIVQARRLFRPIGETLFFPAPIAEWGSFWVGVRQTLARVWARRERKDKTVRSLSVSADVQDNMWEKKITLHEPIGDLVRLENVLKRQLDGTKLPGAVTSLTIKVTSLGPDYAGQAWLFPGSGARIKKIREAFAGIRSRDGESGLYRVAEVEKWSRIPERRYALVSFDL